jgi:streptomycin 6-kinase
VCAHWDLTVERWFDGGAGTPTLAVARSDGTAGVLKVAQPGRLDVAARVMESAGGRGYARVLAWDAELGALLTERLGNDLWAEASTLDKQGPIVVDVLRDAWRVPPDCGRPFTGKAIGLLEILADLGARYGAGHQAAIDRATGYARELAASEHPEVVCHGDPHASNVLRRGAAWVLIDPDGFVGERSYDVGVVLRNGCREIAAAESSVTGSGADLLRQECERLAEIAAVDAERVWNWAFVERVTTGLYLHWHGYADQAASFLDTATLLTW